MRQLLRVNLPVRARPTGSAPISASSVLLVSREPQNRPAARQLPLANQFRARAPRCLHTTVSARVEATPAETNPEPETSLEPETPLEPRTTSNARFTHLEKEGRWLKLSNIRSTSRSRYLDLLWLRDSCSCTHCLNPDSGQKTFSTTDLPDVPELKSARLDPEGNLTLTWGNDSLSNGQDHITIFTEKELRRLYKNSGPRIQHQPPPQKTLWDKSTFEALRAQGKCTISYSDWMTNDEAFWVAFETFTKTGLLFVQDVPESETEVENIASRIGMIQHTFYGHTWDVKSKPHAENVAYTNVFLGLHQDLMYHMPIPRLQLLHCIANSSEGGESLFSDGLRATAEIKSGDPDSYHALTNKLVNFGYEKGGNHYQRSLPTISLDEFDCPISTHWAPPFQTTFPANEYIAQTAAGPKYITMSKWKNAAAVFKKNIEDPKNVIEVKMKPGECVVFDNWRILHGRNEFAIGGQGTRWLKGTYISPQVYQAKETELVRRVLDKSNMAWPANTPTTRVNTWEREQAEWGKTSGLYDFYPSRVRFKTLEKQGYTIREWAVKDTVRKPLGWEANRLKKQAKEQIQKASEIGKGRYFLNHLGHTSFRG